MRGIHRWPVDFPHQGPTNAEVVFVIWRRQEVNCIIHLNSLVSVRKFAKKFPMIFSESPSWYFFITTIYLHYLSSSQVQWKIGQYGFREWFGAIRQQAIVWANVTQDLPMPQWVNSFELCSKHNPLTRVHRRTYIVEVYLFISGHMHWCS